MDGKFATGELIEEWEREAEMEAAADITAGDDEEEAADINERIPFIVKLSGEYELDGRQIREVDLSGLVDLTTADAQDVERVMNKMKHHPQNKFRDIMYTKHIAMKVTGLPVEFFNGLSWKDMEAVSARIAIYFLL